MKKNFFVLILVVTMLAQSVIPAYAYNDADEHYRDIELVLFGNEEYSLTQQEGTKKAIQMLEYASALTIDQFEGTGKDKLKKLSDYKVVGLPSSIDEMDLLGVGPKHHRDYTHRGWDYNYPLDKAHWSIRKKIMLATSNKIFDFRFLSGSVLGYDFGYDDKCNSFCALVYYVHILGDHIEANKKNVSDQKESTQNRIIPLVIDNYNAKNNPDIIDDLIHHLKILFATDQGETRVYDDLIDQLDELKSEASVSISITAGMSSNAFADKLLIILSDSVPVLLSKEVFFQKVFYPDRVMD